MKKVRRERRLHQLVRRRCGFARSRWGWGVDASYRHGRTSIRGGNALVQGGRLASNAFAFDFAKTGVFTRNDKVAIRIVQPLRVRTGGLDINLPVSYDYVSGQVGYQQRFFNLAPTGRELDYEIS